MVSNVVASLLFSLARIHLVSTTSVKSAQNQITIPLTPWWHFSQLIQK